MTIKDFFWTFGKYDLDDYINILMQEKMTLIRMGIRKKS